MRTNEQSWALMSAHGTLWALRSSYLYHIYLNTWNTVDSILLSLDHMTIEDYDPLYAPLISKEWKKHETHNQTE